MKRLLALPIAVCALTISLSPAQALPAHLDSGTAALTPYAFQGDAYGTKVSLGQRVTSGPSAPVVLACGTQRGVHKTNTTAGVDALPILKSGTVSTTADTSAPPAQTQTTAKVQGLNMLSGIITASVIRSASSTSHNQSGFHTSANGTSFTSLVIAGVPVTGVVDPNTKIDLVGFGSLTLNEQTSRVKAGSATLTVNALHLEITQDNALGIPVGTEVIVAHARSGLGGPATATLDGFAYGSKATVAKDVTSGPSFKVTLPCLGTNGKVKVNNGAGVSLPGLLETGNIRNTAQGDVSANSASGETTSTVDSTDLVSGLLQATTIKADAHASSNGTNFTFSDNGSSFASLKVAGFPDIGADVAANTRLRIAGVGVLWLHRVISHPNSIEVRMIELIVKQDNGMGLPIGTDVQIAVAHASAH